MSMDIPDEPLFAITAAELAFFEDPLRSQIKFLCTQYVSEEVRKECEAEMAAAKKNRWKIEKV